MLWGSRWINVCSTEYWPLRYLFKGTACSIVRTTHTTWRLPCYESHEWSRNMRYLIALFLVTLAVLVLINDVGAQSSRRRRRRRTTRRPPGTTAAPVPTQHEPRITKTTPIEATKFSSPVIKLQTKLGLRSQLFNNVVAGYSVTRYELSEAPVYRGGFPVHGSYVSIPENRAVRLSSERVSLLDSNGSLCLGQSSKELTLTGGIENNITEVRAAVKYENSLNDKTLSGVNNTVPLNDVKDKTFTVTSRARYGIPVVDNTQCTQVEKEVNGTMIQLYEFNPNTAGITGIDSRLIFASITVIGILNGLK